MNLFDVESAIIGRLDSKPRKAHAFERDRANVLASQLAGLAERVERMEAGLGARYPIAA